MPVDHFPENESTEGYSEICEALDYQIDQIDLPSETVATPVAEKILELDSFEVFDIEDTHSSHLNKMFTLFSIY